MRRTTRHVAPPKKAAAKATHPAPPMPLPAEHAQAEPEIDVRQCFEHLLAAIEALARPAGSPLEVVSELQALRALLGKE